MGAEVSTITPSQRFRGLHETVCGRHVAPDTAAIEAAWHLGRDSMTLNPCTGRGRQRTSAVSHWAVIGVESSVGWPTKETEVEFGPYRLTMRPETEDQAPTVIMQFPPPATMDEALIVLRRFLSALCWVEGHVIRETMSTGGSAPFGIGKGIRSSTRAMHFRADYLPYPDDPKGRLALGLYREAMGVNSVAYSFLGYAKILNILHGDPRKQIDWINQTLPDLSDHRAKERIAELRKQESDVGGYLYGSGRCAIAHAFAEPIVDPEDPEDARRLYADLPVIRALAAHLIEDELGIQSAMTVWKEHRYELEGFRLLIGEDNAENLKAGKMMDPRTAKAWPRLSLRMRDHPPFTPFEAMTVRKSQVLADIGVIQVTCRSADTLVELMFGLDFHEGRILADPEMDIRIRDDGTATSFDHAAEHQRFRKLYYLNGELEILNAETGERLGRCDPFLPLNIDLSGTDKMIEEAIAKHKADADLRRRLPERDRC